METNAKKNTLYMYKGDIELQSKGMNTVHVDIEYNDLEGEYFKISVNGSLETIDLNEEQLNQLMFACHKLKQFGKGISISK